MFEHGVPVVAWHISLENSSLLEVFNNVLCGSLSSRGHPAPLGIMTGAQSMLAQGVGPRLVDLHSSSLQCSLSRVSCFRFLEGDMDDPAANSKRHNMLKLIPSVPQGSWIIKQSVGSTPVLLGNKISTTYHRYHSVVHHSMLYRILTPTSCSVINCSLSCYDSCKVMLLMFS